jgi:DNA-binding HxlR family transcriptional regulator
MDPQCTVYRTIEVISRKWSMIILFAIYKGNKPKKRYSEIKREVKGVTSKMISSRLKELVKEGMIRRSVDESSIPKKVYYSLTSSGQELIDIILHVKKWGLKWKFKNKECYESVCRYCDA